MLFVHWIRLEMDQIGHLKCPPTGKYFFSRKIRQAVFERLRKAPFFKFAFSVSYSPSFLGPGKWASSEWFKMLMDSSGRFWYFLRPVPSLHCSSLTVHRIQNPWWGWDLWRLQHEYHIESDSSNDIMWSKWIFYRSGQFSRIWKIFK